MNIFLFLRKYPSFPAQRSSVSVLGVQVNRNPQKTKTLPPALFQEAVNYIDYLSQKAQAAYFAEKPTEAEHISINAKLPRSTVRGCLKDKVWMADDFNAPLEEFQEYM